MRANPTHYAGMLHHMGGVPVGPDLAMTKGEVIYVDGVNGSNSNSGTIDDPLLTMTLALDKCTDDIQDVIYILDYWQPTGETWPISINKTMVRIIGNNAFPLSKWAVMASSGNFPVFDIVSNYVVIEGISFYPTNGYPGITMDDQVAHVWIKYCEFQKGSYGVQLASADAANAISITDCMFIASLASGGIYVADDPAFMYIARNQFDRVSGISIDIEAGAGHVIVDNRFALKTNTEGLAITLASGVARAFVDGNSAAFGDATTTSPYKDEGTVTTNNWGTNRLGGTVIAPA